MSSVETRLSINPLFYDALSGEFTPYNDPSYRKHTLGRLLVATFQKGEVMYPEPPQFVDGTEYQVREYQPSWAPEITARLQSLEKTGRAFAKDIILHRGEYNNNSRLHIGEVMLENGLRIVRPGQMVMQFIPLQLGDSLNLARTAVTKAAHDFFTRQEF